MTNEEKINELAEKAPINFISKEDLCTYRQGFICGATKIAEWKDEQMKEALNNILIECDACFDEQTTNTLESIIKHQIDIL